MHTPGIARLYPVPVLLRGSGIYSDFSLSMTVSTMLSLKMV